MAGQTNGNSTTVTTTYDTSNRPTEILHKQSGGTTLADYQYAYDSVGNVTTRTDSDGTVTTFGYDASDQLTSEVRDNTHSTGYSISYVYDHNQNRTSKTIGGVTDTYSYNSHDKLTSTSSKSYGYDNNGNCTSVTVGSNTTSLTYNDDNRVTGITYPSTATNSFAYNGLGLRVSKTDSTGSFSYVCDGTSPASPVLKDGAATYTPGLSERRGSTSKFQHADALGSTRGITDSTQATTDAILYDAFGMTVSRTGTTPTPFGFVGGSQYQTDSDSGLMLLGNRYYDASIGRFISSDPAKAGTNWFAYCENNPLTRIDPTGKFLFILVAILIVSLLVDSEAPAGNEFGNPNPPGRLHPLTPGVLGGAIGGVIAAPYVSATLAVDFSAETGTTIGGTIGEGGGLLNNCFVSGTLVRMANGATKPIERVKVGDRVVSRDTLSGKTAAKKVLRTFIHKNAKTLQLRFASGEQITTTPGHSFFVKGKGFVLAGHLAVGNAIVTRAGPPVKVVDIEQHSAKATVYNFEVEDYHTYFVGSHTGGLWVHNDSIPDPYAGDPFPGVSPKQGRHTPGMGPSYTPFDPTRTTLDPSHLPAGKTIEDVLADGWANPVPGHSMNPNDGFFIGSPGYPVDDQGTMDLIMRSSKKGVHGYPNR